MTKNCSNKPLCAVLLAAYNGEKWIDEQIRSILAQKKINVNIFISIDESDDSTLFKVRNWSNSDDRIIVLPYGERYGSAARNFYRLIKDVDVSCFDIIAFSDQDDIWHSDKLYRSWIKISNNECDIYSGDVVAFWENGKKSLIKKSYPQKKYDHFFEAAGPGCTYVFSTDSFLKIQEFICLNFDEASKIESHDWLVYAFCRSLNLKWHIDNMPKMLYRQHENNQVGANNNIKAYLKRFRIIKKKQYYKQINLIYKLVLNDSTFFSLNRINIIKNIAEVRRRPRDRIAILLFIIMKIF